MADATCSNCSAKSRKPDDSGRPPAWTKVILVRPQDRVELILCAKCAGVFECWVNKAAEEVRKR